MFAIENRQRGRGAKLETVGDRPIGGFGAQSPFPARLLLLNTGLQSIVVRFGGGYPLVEQGQLFLLLRQWSLDIRLLIAVVVRKSFFVGDVIEVSEKPVEVLLQKGIVLMIVAAGTAQGKAHPNRGSGLRAIGDIFHSIFFGNNAALAVRAMV